MITELKKGQVVISKAGHDKGKAMVILEIIDHEKVSIIDGKTRKIQKPKIKKNKHLQPVGKYVDLNAIEEMKDENQKNAYVQKILSHIL